MKYFIFNINPLNYIKELDKEYLQDNCTLMYFYSEKNSDGSSSRLEIKFNKIEQYYDLFYSRVEDMLKPNSKIEAFRNERLELINEFTDINQNLENKI